MDKNKEKTRQKEGYGKEIKGKRSKRARGKEGGRKSSRTTRIRRAKTKEGQSLLGQEKQEKGGRGKRRKGQKETRTPPKKAKYNASFGGESAAARRGNPNKRDECEEGHRRKRGRCDGHSD